MWMPKVSIILPVFNVSNYIRKCLISIIEQKGFKDYEVIIVNDGTEDDSIDKIIDLIDFYNNIKLINKSNGGVGQARNIGISRSIGQYILFVDSDDWLEKDMIYTMYKRAVNTNSEIVICGANKAYEDNSIEKMELGNLPRDSFPKDEVIKTFLNRNFLIGNFLWNKLIKRDLLVSNNIFFPEKQDFGEDALIVLKTLFYANKIAIVQQQLYNYLQRNGSITKGDLKKEAIFIKNLHRMKKFLLEKQLLEKYKVEFRNYELRIFLNINGRASRNLWSEDAVFLKKIVKNEIQSIKFKKVVFGNSIDYKTKFKFLLYKIKLDNAAYYFLQKFLSGNLHTNKVISKKEKKWVR
ncbi:glycosyltransferase [Heyndrickxia coagulans]|uniref:Glycosyl transferase family 2 n=2 Tax=Heyndrickxia coagulans TaxID=1398 RepID=A0A8B4BXD6_HEYCO|nr:glycosyltransferase [Heyndrickxia coagulans]AJH78228.1 glycosyltransferase like 2 family protein [Heyndrickxia coagulans DSM 1 = ATCC 7050]MCR2846560.1 glycosyltransferase [Heyndrickxia coagulans]MDR4224816.1 glycosyltransferase [Heyndrickxia coagulans DSM 1 = ATCC 7050]MED4493768.1 glycosyltransferase [Heyndrickxia coagulans]MED4536988.1 glycosyltransferase [Heyndrickxia coagulans]